MLFLFSRFLLRSSKVCAQAKKIKELRKAIMKRTRLKNIANETKREEDIKRYREQRNLVVKVNTNAKCPS